MVDCTCDREARIHERTGSSLFAGVVSAGKRVTSSSHVCNRRIARYSLPSELHFRYRHVGPGVSAGSRNGQTPCCQLCSYDLPLLRSICTHSTMEPSDRRNDKGP